MRRPGGARVAREAMARHPRSVPWVQMTSCSCRFDARGKVERGTRALWLDGLQTHLRVTSESELQAFTQRREARAESPSVGAEPDACIGYANTASAVAHRDVDLDATALFARVYAVTNRVLDEREQRHRRAA